MRNYLLIIFLLLSGLVASAQSLTSLIVSGDAARSGMAGVSVAMPADAFSLDNNAAAMSLSDNKFDAAFNYGKWQPKETDANLLGFGAYFRPGKKLAFGLSFKNMRWSSYDVYSESGVASGSYTPKEFSFAIAGSYKIIDCLSVGVTLRFGSSKLASEAEASLFNADISLKYEKEAFQAGLALSNLGGEIKYGDNSYNQPSLVKAGAAYSIKGLTASAEVDYLFSEGLMAGIGAQYAYKDMLFVRAGYHYGAEDADVIPSYASAGLGLKFFGVHLDFSYLFASDTLAGSMNITLGYSF